MRKFSMALPPWDPEREKGWRGGVKERYREMNGGMNKGSNKSVEDK